MMKKLLLLWIVSAFCSAVVAAGHIELRIAPEDVNPGGYQASDTITIQIYAAGFYENYPGDTIGFMDIAAVQSDNGGTASEPNLHSALAVGIGASAGDVINAGGVLIEDIRGYKAALDLVGVYPFPAVLWECEFHIPDLSASSIITISLSGLSLTNVGNQTIVPSYTVGEPLEIQMACCPGDTNNDGDIDIDDYNKVKGKLSQAGFFNNGVYYIAHSDPNTGFLWDAALDCDPWGVGDGDVDIDDFNRLKGKLSQAGFFNNGVYYIAPGDPNTGFLWPCN